MARTTVQVPTITKGTRLTDFAGLNLTAEGSSAGGMGLVVWGYDAASKQMEALKLLRPDRLADAAARSPEQRRAVERQFEDEALVWCHLWYHPCVVRAFGLTRLPALDNLAVLELEYVPSGSLRDRLRRGQAEHTHASLRAALAWAIHIASALAHIHQPDPDHDRPEPLIHCDLKPENVLLNAQGWAQLTDLGLTRAYAALAADSVTESEIEAEHDPATRSAFASNAPALAARRAEVARLRAVLQAAGALPLDATPVADTLFATHTLRIPSSQALPAPAVSAPPFAAAAIGSRGPVAGSPPYMAPEQWLGLDATVPATDLYAFGVLLYELLAGTESPYPFPHDPTPFLTPQLYAHAQAAGYSAVLLAWHAAHTASSGPAHHLSDPDVTAGALRSGPLAELVGRQDAEGRQTVDVVLGQLDVLITACLAADPTVRPSAASVQRQLLGLLTGPCGLESIPVPEPLPVTPKGESAFWSNLGVTYRKLAREEEAIPAQRRALDFTPTDAINWINLGNSLNSLGEQERRQAAEASASGRGGEAAALVAAADQHSEEALATYQQAEAHLTPQALDDNPTLLAALTSNQATVLGALGRYAEAVAANRRALTLQPDWHDTRFNLALEYARWSQVPNTSPAKCLERLQTAAAEIQMVLDVTPDMAGASGLAERIARALADPEHRFRG